MSQAITQLKTEYDKKVKEIQDLMKNPNRDAGLFHVDIGFQDKGVHFANQGGTITSSVDRLENYPVKGYPYKRGIKLSFEDGYEPCVEACGGADLYGICTDIDEFTGTATVMPITNNFTGYLVVKKSSQSSITPGVKVKFDTNGEIENDSGSGSRIINGIALSKAFKINENLYIALVSIFGNRGVS
ncbi:Hypothetical protein BHY_0952 (plasmid) [Borrelia nietonii YOR]|uniref:Uncharacterized protein n=1 Tax=Borrelia nietonii YOR TaxID=1293576 RepID=W5SB39_9SPIR|nr:MULTISPECIES: DUF228 domain-containing protein [Borrelia]AHH03903.1 Hypothetical protein BHY_0952 [Borrelia nietonii YOR]AHH14349.1 Hypothetical protein BHW_0122500 [Borrelia hermsii MTW]UPA09622.1 DUF228 domain-containing protein [Borrelia nietonii YOR]UPA09686.1 DUF228 domain-containing protein [Borrelia nietonii YOR]UPA09725.1 DUF228 domain-containing protein [Borrelia nietonii YOR]